VDALSAMGIARQGQTQVTAGHQRAARRSPQPILSRSPARNGALICFSKSPNTVEFMIGAGPEWTYTDRSNKFATEFTLDFMFRALGRSQARLLPGTDLCLLVQQGARAGSGYQRGGAHTDSMTRWLRTAASQHFVRYWSAADAVCSL
jgi:hypothetical protein